VHFCNSARPTGSLVHLSTVWVLNCTHGARSAEMVHKCTPTSPTQRS
jgi:hypothetical protein